MSLFGLIARTVFGSFFLIITVSLLTLFFKMAKKLSPHQTAARIALYSSGIVVAAVIVVGLFFLLLKIGMDNMV